MTALQTIDISEDWPWYRVKAALEARQRNFSELARTYKKSPAYFRLLKFQPNPKAQSLLASELDRPPQTIWPSRYTRDGEPVSRIDWLKANKRSTQRHAQMRGAS